MRRGFRHLRECGAQAVDLIRGKRLGKQRRRRFGDGGLETSPEQILLTPSGTQAIDLICGGSSSPGRQLWKGDCA